MPRLFGSLIAGLAASFVCAAQTVTLGVSSGSASPGNSVTLNLSLTGSTSDPPVAAQWTLVYSTSDFSSVVVAAGPKSTAASKTVSCNGTAGDMTCVVWGVNTTPISNGVVATVMMTVSASTTHTSSVVQVTQGLATDAPATSLTASTSSGTVTIQSGLNGFSCNPLSVNPLVSSSCTVALTSAAPSGGATVALSAAPTAANLPATVTIPQNALSTNFTVTAGTVATATPVTLTASYLGIGATFNVTVNPAPPPANVSVTPSSGSGLSQTFSFVYTDPYGASDISWTQMHFQTQLVAQSACYLQYTRANNTIVLINDAGAGTAGSTTLGASGNLENSQCILNAAASSASSSGNNLTVNLALTFTGSFAGAKNISMGAINNASVFSGWQQMGTWTVPSGGSQTAVNTSVAPSSGSGSSQAFSFVYTDPAGASDINLTQVHFQTQLVAQSACYLQYTRSTNTIVLINDAGSGAGGSITLGSSGTLQNSQCTLNAASSSASSSGNNLTVNLSLIFTPAFAGTKNISMGVVNNANAFSGWQQMGTWTVTVGNLPPANVSVSPASGSGPSGTLAFTYSDPYGYTDLSLVQLDFQTQLVGNAACYIQYTPATNTAQLINDAGTGYTGSGGTLGSSGTLSNSQCTINLSTSSASGSGNNFTLTLALSFSTSFAGSQNVYMGAVNSANLFSGWQQMGAWTVIPANEQPPANVSVTPSSGSGLSQTFAFTYSDPYGNSDINWVQMHFQAQLVANNACYVQYTTATHTAQLINDSGTGYVGSGGTLGSSGTLANSQCTINLGSSSASGSGNNFTVNLSITFSNTFTGSKNINMGAVDNASLFSGWEQMGTWTP
jgi:hypothetical protein